MFKSISDVYRALEQGGGDSKRVLSFLENAIEQEAHNLCSLNEDTYEGNLKSAQEHFVEEINVFMTEDTDITPFIIMNYRRRPKAWAVAKSIQEVFDANSKEESDSSI